MDPKRQEILAALEATCSKVMEAEPNKNIFNGTKEDIDTIGYIYYHEYDSAFDTAALEKGAAMVLCNLLEALS